MRRTLERLLLLALLAVLAWAASAPPPAGAELIERPPVEASDTEESQGPLIFLQSSDWPVRRRLTLTRDRFSLRTDGCASHRVTNGGVVWNGDTVTLYSRGGTHVLRLRRYARTSRLEPTDLAAGWILEPPAPVPIDSPSLRRGGRLEVDGLWLGASHEQVGCLYGPAMGVDSFRGDSYLLRDFFPLSVLYDRHGQVKSIRGQTLAVDGVPVLNTRSTEADLKAVLGMLPQPRSGRYPFPEVGLTVSLRDDTRRLFYVELTRPAP